MAGARAFAGVGEVPPAGGPNIAVAAGKRRLDKRATGPGSLRDNTIGSGTVRGARREYISARLRCGRVLPCRAWFGR